MSSTIAAAVRNIAQLDRDAAAERGNKSDRERRIGADRNAPAVVHGPDGISMR